MEHCSVLNSIPGVVGDTELVTYHPSFKKILRGLWMSPTSHSVLEKTGKHYLWWPLPLCLEVSAKARIVRKRENVVLIFLNSKQVVCSCCRCVSCPSFLRVWVQGSPWFLREVPHSTQCPAPTSNDTKGIPFTSLTPCLSTSSDYWAMSLQPEMCKQILWKDFKMITYTLNQFNHTTTHRRQIYWGNEFWWEFKKGAKTSEH